MANVKISELPASGSVANGSLLAVVEGGVTKKATREEVIEPAQIAADDAQADATQALSDAAGAQADATQALSDAADALEQAAYIRNPLTKGAGNFTLALADLYQGLVITAAAVITVPKNAVVALPVGIVIPIFRVTAGAVSVSPVDGDVTIKKAETLVLRKENSPAELWQYATNTWLLTGDLELV